MAAMRPADATPDITSTANPRVKAVAGLRDRRDRERTGRTIVDGAREVRRAIESGAVIDEAFVCVPLLQGPDARAALDRLTEAGVRITTTSPTVFEKLAFGERAEGLVAVVRVPSLALDDLAPAGRSPRRRARRRREAGQSRGRLAQRRWCRRGCADRGRRADRPVQPERHPRQCGHGLRCALAVAPADAVIAWLREREIRIVATRVDAPAAYANADLRGPLAIALGSETDGLTEQWDGAGIETVSLPMLGIADSLNVSVTAAVLLYEARRQRGRPAV